MKQLVDKVAVITGAGNGIGRALAVVLGGQGCRLVLADVEAQTIAALEQELRNIGVQVVAHATDVSDWEDVRRLRDAAIEAFGAVHVLCNNAGISTAGTALVDTSLEDWRWTIDVNLMGVVHGIRAFLPDLVDQPEAHVLNTASAAAFSGGSYNGPYSATKAAVLSISESLYRELHDDGATNVGVSVVCPGAVRTTIADSERRRPDRRRSEEPDRRRLEMVAYLERVRSGGIAPDDAAQTIVEAIREDRFYVFTHDLESAVRSRSDRALAGLPPLVQPRVT